MNLPDLDAAFVSRERTAQRDGGGIRGESAFNRQGESDEIGIAQVVGDEPTPEFAVQVTEEYRRLLDLLEDETLKTVAQWKLEGYYNDEIAQKLDCVPRTVERKLHRIRIIWEEEPQRCKIYCFRRRSEGRRGVAGGVV